MNRLLLLTTAAALLSTLGCTPGVWIRRQAPASVNLGPTRALVLAHPRGAPEAVNTAIEALHHQLMSDGYFQLYRSLPQGTDAPPAFIRLHVRDYDYFESARTEWVERDGGQVERTLLRPRAHTALFIELTGADGRVLVADTFEDEVSALEYEPGRDAPPVAQQLLADAAQAAVRSFLWRITPRTVSEKLRLDETDPGTRAGITLAERGEWERALAEFERLSAAKPDSAPALYNQGVVLEVMGQPERAVERYEAANRLQPKGLYRNALEQLRRRVADVQSLATRTH
jgi:tetratricopeptide (TPR) repeat protein